MAAKHIVRIDRGPIEAKDRLDTVPKEKWHDLMLARRYFLEVHLSSDCRCLVEFVNDAQAMFGELGFSSAENMVRDGYGLEPKEIAIAVEWLKLNPSGEPLPLDQAITLGRHGGDRKSDKAKVQGADGTLKRGSNSSAYIIARLNRDRPDLAAKVDAKKMSARAAGIEAGFVKDPTPLEQILKWLPRLTPRQRQQLRRKLDEMDERKAA